MRRLWAATEARALGYGGVSTVARAVGLTRPTITAGMKELGDARQLVAIAPKHRVRREGAGRPRVTDSDAGLRPALEDLVEPATRGHPMSPLPWTCKSVRTLAAELTRQGHAVSHQTVSEVLQRMGYSLQANRKTREGAEHADRNAQFEHIARRAKEFQQRGQPVISVDTKKKELVGTSRMPGGNGTRRASRQPYGCTTSRMTSWARRSVRCVRPRRQRRLGECRGRSRHAGVCSAALTTNNGALESLVKASATQAGRARPLGEHYVSALLARTPPSAPLRAGAFACREKQMAKRRLTKASATAITRSQPSRWPRWGLVAAARRRYPPDVRVWFQDGAGAAQPHQDMHAGLDGVSVPRCLGNCAGRPKSDTDATLTRSTWRMKILRAPGPHSQKTALPDSRSHLLELPLVSSGCLKAAPWKDERKGRAAAGCAFDADRSAVQLDEALCECQAQARAFRFVQVRRPPPGGTPRTPAPAGPAQCPRRCRLRRSPPCRRRRQGARVASRCRLQA